MRQNVLMPCAHLLYPHLCVGPPCHFGAKVLQCNGDFLKKSFELIPLQGSTLLETSAVIPSLRPSPLSFKTPLNSPLCACVCLGPIAKPPPPPAAHTFTPFLQQGLATRRHRCQRGAFAPEPWRNTAAQ